MSETVIAIDPGAAGGLAVAHASGRVDCHPMPATIRDVIDLLCALVERHYTDSAEAPVVVMEEPPSYAGRPQSGSSAYKFGRAVGQIEGVVQTLRLRLERVTPRRWQRDLGLGTRAKDESPTKWKARLKARAQELYPEQRITLKTADALLILEWARSRNSAQPRLAEQAGDNV